jgi:hypothetical protein
VQAITETIAAWSVFPNPAVNEVTVKLLQKEDGKTTVAIWDMQGRQVVKKQFMLAKGLNAIKINNFKQAGFTSGTYLLKVSSPNESKIFKLIVE